MVQKQTRPIGLFGICAMQDGSLVSRLSQYIKVLYLALIILDKKYCNYTKVLFLIKSNNSNQFQLSCDNNNIHMMKLYLVIANNPGVHIFSCTKKLIKDTRLHFTIVHGSLGTRPPYPTFANSRRGYLIKHLHFI